MGWLEMGNGQSLRVLGEAYMCTPSVAIDRNVEEEACLFRVKLYNWAKQLESTLPFADPGAGSEAVSSPQLLCNGGCGVLVTCSRTVLCGPGMGLSVNNGPLF